jgi:hypothetical protein
MIQQLRSIIGVFVVILICTNLTGCFSLLGDKEPEINATLDQLYKKYNDQAYDDIYNELTTDDYKKVVTKDKNKKIFIFQNKHLGKFLTRDKGDDATTQVQYTPEGIFYSIEFKGKFQKGEAVTTVGLSEDQSKKLKIHGYHFNIDAI